jgi:lipopolysaccharide exporter
MQVPKGDNAHMGYTKNAVAGFSWQTILKVGVAAITIVKIYFLARLLTPSDFGVFSLVTIALGISEATTQTGVNVTMLQSKQSVAYFVDSAWVIAIIRGFVIGVLMMLAGLAMSSYYQLPSLIMLVGLASIVPVIKGFINPAIIKLQKEFRFLEDSGFRFTLVLTEATVAVSLAAVTHSVTALIISLIVAAFIEVLISQVFFKTKPRFNYVKSRGKVILENAKWLSFSALFSYLHENVDNLLIGKLTSSFKLGLYHIDYGLSHKVNYDFAKSANHGTFPIFTRLSDQPQRLKKAFYKSGGTTLLLVTATSIPVFLLPDFFVNFLLGDQWLAIIPLIRWLVLAGILQSITALLYNLLITQKQYLFMNIHLVASVGLLILLVTTMTPTRGLLGAVGAVFLSRLLTLPIIIYGVVQLLNSNHGQKSWRPLKK